YFQDSRDLDTICYPFLKSHPQYELALKQMSQGGGIITLTVKGGVARAQKFIDQLRMISVTSNLRDTRSIITHPASTTHSKLTEEERLSVGITPGLVMLYVCFVQLYDIIMDIERLITYAS